MNLQYFTEVKDLKTLKEQYRKLVLKLHPDRGGDEQRFKDMQNEFEYLQSSQNFFTSEETREDVNAEMERFRHILDEIIHLSNFGVKIEIVGSWIWLTGATYTFKELFKKLNFRFSGKKLAWYYHEGEYQRKGKKSYSLEEIKAKYGSKQIIDSEGSKFLKYQS